METDFLNLWVNRIISPSSSLGGLSSGIFCGLWRWPLFSWIISCVWLEGAWRRHAEGKSCTVYLGRAVLGRSLVSRPSFASAFKENTTPGCWPLICARFCMTAVWNCQAGMEKLPAELEQILKDVDSNGSGLSTQVLFLLFPFLFWVACHCRRHPAIQVTLTTPSFLAATLDRSISGFGMLWDFLGGQPGYFSRVLRSERLIRLILELLRGGIIWKAKCTSPPRKKNLLTAFRLLEVDS